MMIAGKKYSPRNSLGRVLIFAALLLVPVASLHAGTCPPTELIPCGCDNSPVNGIVEGAEMCTFDDLIILAQNFINFLIFKIASPLAAIMFAYAGFLYLTNGGNESKVKQAHDIFTAVFIGLVVALGAWLLIYFIVNFFLAPSYVYLAPP